MQRSVLFALASGLYFAFAAAVPANAAERYVANIEYGDLNLASTRGADAFIGRTLQAARETCSDRYGPMTLVERGRINRCESRLASRAVTELSNPIVTARYQERGGRAGWVTLSER